MAQCKQCPDCGANLDPGELCDCKPSPRYEFVAVDFDGTLCENKFPDIGDPRPFIIAYIKHLAGAGSKIILHTCREDGTRPLLTEAVEFCARHEIPLYAVNENPGNLYAARFGMTHDAGRKVYADLYVDDKAVNPDDIMKNAALGQVLTLVRARLIDSLSVLGAGEHAARAFIRTAIRLIDRGRVTSEQD